MRLFDYLREQGLTNRAMRQAFEAGHVYLDDVPTGDGGRDITEHRVTVRANAPRLVPGRDPVVVYRDPHLAVVCKPSGLLSVPHASRRGERSVLSFVKYLFGEALAVHRLDEGTSGLMVVALTERMQLHLRDDLARRDISRRYLALVRHHFAPDAQPRTFDSVLVRNRGDGKRGTRDDEAGDSADEGKRAVTHVRLIEALRRDASLVEAQLETGRTHQVRIHMAEAGYPVLGDDLYGSRHVASAAARLALHAWQLGFTHPATGETMTFTAPLADDLEKLRRSLNETLPRPRTLR